MKPGEVMIYDNQGRQFYFSASGPIINCNGAPLNIIGDVMVNGKIIATGDIVGNGISLGDHEHGNGNNGGNTTPPIAGT
jgi:phage baseplate assembly protein gpV